MKIQSIRFKITAITVAAILTAMLCVFLVSYPTIRVETNRRSAEMMRLIGDDTRNTLDEYFVDIVQCIEIAANMAVDSLDSVVLVECGAAGRHAQDTPRSEEQTARLDAYIRDHCTQILHTFESIASHTNGVVTYYYCINPEISETEHGFFYSRVGKAGFVAREPLDARTLDPADIEHTTWYYTTIQRGRPTWIGPYTAHFLNEMWISSYLVPIYCAGTLVGVLGMDIPLDTLIAQVSPIRVYDTGYASLYDSEGNILYHPELAAGKAPALFTAAFGDQLKNSDSAGVLTRYDADGEELQMFFSTLKNGMKLVITAPTKEINASWLRLVRAVMLITTIVVVIFAGIILLAMRILTSPLLQLTAAARRLADGDYAVSLNYRSSDEIGMLTRAFVRMRDKLRDTIEDLNRRVNTDTLTGLPNMRCFFKLAESQRKELMQSGEQPVVLFFDLIGMKHYNRQYGFDEGDRLLRDIARILGEGCISPCVCRYSEDHFAAVCGENGLEEKLERFFSACEGANGGNSLPVRAGVYRMGMEDVSVSVACDRAKYACDRHRDSYVSGWYMFDEEMLAQLDGVRYVISHLDQALKEHWIQVYYQPIIRAVNGRVCDEESLSRWIDPKRGMLSPAFFIPILENARLIYKLDLYVLDQILEKMQAQRRAGLQIVPHSLNLSRADFDSCDIVAEICRRVDAAGIRREKITIEITESIIGSDFDFMKAQIERFQSLGFRVWMDDFGSGYSSLDVLQDVHFDLLKFDMRFMKRFSEGEECKIILTDMVRLAIDLGIDTVCEGVETAEEAEFLREIGCSKLQGFLFCRPVPYEEILRRYEQGIQIGFENPEESDYFAAIGRVDLYDLTVIADKESAQQDYFNSLPVGIMEILGETVSFVRTNPAYRDFVKRAFGFDLSARSDGYPARPANMEGGFISHARQCCHDGARVFFDGQLADGSTVHVIMNPVGTNPVTGAAAVTIAVLSVTGPDDATTYAEIARALAADYYNIYVVDLDTDHFIEYSSPVGGEELAMERHGTDFFESARRDAMTRIYADDREGFLAVFTKANIIRELDAQGVFTSAYRLIDSGAPVYVNMKLTRMPGGNRIIMGISITDAQMKQANTRG